MKVSGIDIDIDTDIEDDIDKIKQQIEGDKTLPLSIPTSLDLLILIINILCQWFGNNSRNSRKPPSREPNREIH